MTPTEAHVTVPVPVLDAIRTPEDYADMVTDLFDTDPDAGIRSIALTQVHILASIQEINNALVPLMEALRPYAEDPSRVLAALPEPFRSMLGVRG